MDSRNITVANKTLLSNDTCDTMTNAEKDIRNSDAALEIQTHRTILRNTF